MPQYIYVGDMDDNDAVGFSDGFDLADRDLIYELFGDPVYIWKRWPIAEEIYDSVQNSSQFVIYTGIGHTITGEMFEDIKRFFDMPAGDINDDWSVNLSDAILVLQVLAVQWTPAHGIFDVEMLTLADWLWATLVASSVLVLEEARKLVLRIFQS